MSEWRDIESAPKDGTEILGIIDGCVYLLCWVNNEGDHGYTGWAYGDIGSGGSLYCGVNEISEISDNSPTHWMPLPNPPEETK